MRVLLSNTFKKTLSLRYPRPRSRVVARFGFTAPQFSALLHDREAVGARTRPRIVEIEALLGLSETETFRVVRRGWRLLAHAEARCRALQGDGGHTATRR